MVETLHAIDKCSTTKYKFPDLLLLALNFTKLLVIFGTKSQFFFKLYITLQCHETQLFCTFLSKSLYALDKRSPWQCKFPDFRLLAWKLTKYLMSFFKPQVSFHLNFASLSSVMTHNSSEIFWLKHYMLWTERAHQCTIFQIFGCSNESLLNSSCYFWNRKARVYSNFASLFSVKPLCIFLAQTSYTLTKKTHRSKIFRLLSTWVKIHQIPHVIFGTTSQFF